MHMTQSCLVLFYRQCQMRLKGIISIVWAFIWPQSEQMINDEYMHPARQKNKNVLVATNNPTQQQFICEHVSACM